MSRFGPSGIQDRMTSLRSPFHPGEVEVQRRAGVREEADQVGTIIGGRIPPAFVPILAGFRFVVAASIDGGGRVWASLLTGPPGFLKAAGETRVRLDARPEAGDPLAANLAARSELGLLVIDPATRRRMRLNGLGSLDPAGGISLDIEQVYGNCRKYIQARQLVDDTGGRQARPEAGESRAASSAPLRSARLTPAQIKMITAADTFFIASAHPEGGADASHRGGRPGFVRVEGDRTLSFADYAGNNMYNTLGNLVAEPRAGLLFVDFTSGDLVQITGHARLDWEPVTVAQHRGANQVVVTFEVDEVIETPGGSPLRWKLVEPSPFNP